MSEILISTGALIGRPNRRDYTLLKEFKKNLTCDGFEFMMYDTWYEKADEIIDFLKNEDIYTPVMHCEKTVGMAVSIGGEENFLDAEKRFRINCDIARKLGAQKLVIHLWDGMPSDSQFENNLFMYEKLRRIAEEYGIDMLVENVVCNVKSPFVRWEDLLKRYPDAHLIFDTKMAAFHEEDVLLYEERNAYLWKEGLLRHYHVNDYGGGYKDWANLKTLPIGKGHVDFGRFFDFIQKTGYDETFTIEATAFDQNGVVDFAMLNESVGKIREYLGETKKA